MWGEWAVCRIGLLERRRRGWRGLSWQGAASGGGPFTLGPPLDRSVQHHPLTGSSLLGKGAQGTGLAAQTWRRPRPQSEGPPSRPRAPLTAPSPYAHCEALGLSSVRRTAHSPAARAPQLGLPPVSGTRRCLPASVPEVTSWAPARREASETLKVQRGPRRAPRAALAQAGGFASALPLSTRMCRGLGLRDPPRPGSSDSCRAGSCRPPAHAQAPLGCPEQTFRPGPLRVQETGSEFSDRGWRSRLHPSSLPGLRAQPAAGCL